jgi:hypothetical protein
MLLNIRQLMDAAKCYEVVRELRWSDGVKCHACESGQINKHGIAVRSVDDNSMT